MATRHGVFLLKNEYFWLPREESCCPEVETQGNAGRVHGAIVYIRLEPLFLLGGIFGG